MSYGLNSLVVAAERFIAEADAGEANPGDYKEFAAALALHYSSFTGSDGPTTIFYPENT